MLARLLIAALLSAVPIQSIPIQFPILDQTFPSIPKDFCILTPDLGYSGKNTYLEDCENLNFYSNLPIPANRNRKVDLLKLPNILEKNISIRKLCSIHI